MCIQLTGGIGPNGICPRGIVRSASIAAKDCLELGLFLREKLPQRRALRLVPLLGEPFPEMLDVQAGYGFVHANTDPRPPTG
jgi:hypothetical protein